jgi:VanZ family protein
MVTLASASNFTAGQSLHIQPTFTPSDTTDYELTWQSSNPELATVSSGGDFGLVIGKLSGTVTITATSVMDASIQATITLKILPAPLFSPAQWEAFLVFVRKGIGHFSLNMMNGFLGFLTFYTYIDERKKYRDVLLSILVGLPLSAFFESLQFFAPGRTPAWEDVFYNTSGYLTGQAVMIVMFTLIAWLSRRKHSQKKT